MADFKQDQKSKVIILHYIMQTNKKDTAHQLCNVFLKISKYSGIRTLNHSSIYFAYYSMNAAKITSLCSCTFFGHLLVDYLCVFPDSQSELVEIKPPQKKISGN